jgi:hypothetical protein
MDKLIVITTARYSALFTQILRTYSEDSQIKIDGLVYCGHDISKLLSEWCTNEQIKRTLNFELQQHGQPLFGFHDHPRELWAAISELPFIKQLQKERLIRYRVLPFESRPKRPVTDFLLYISGIFVSLLMMVLLPLVASAIRIIRTIYRQYRKTD